MIGLHIYLYIVVHLNGCDVRVLCQSIELIIQAKLTEEFSNHARTNDFVNAASIYTNADDPKAVTCSDDV